MEFFTATGKLKKFFFLTTRDVRCVYHGTHRYAIKVLAPHTRVNMLTRAQPGHFVLFSLL